MAVTPAAYGVLMSSGPSVHDPTPFDENDLLPLAGSCSACTATRRAGGPCRLGLWPAGDRASQARRVRGQAQRRVRSAASHGPGAGATLRHDPRIGRYCCRIGRLAHDAPGRLQLWTTRPTTTRARRDGERRCVHVRSASITSFHASGVFAPRSSMLLGDSVTFCADDSRSTGS